MEETKVIYYIDDEETPYLMKIPQPPSKVTLADFKGQLNRTYQKFFFKSVDDDFGVVKEELTEDENILPNQKGRVVCWVISGDQNASGSDAGGSKGDLESESRGKEEDDVSIMSGTSRASSRRSGHRHHHHHRSHHHKSGRSRHRHHGPPNGVGPGGSMVGASDIGSITDYTTSTDIETTSFCDSEDTLSRVSASTITSLKNPRKKVLTKHKIPRSMSCSTMTTSSMTDVSTQIVKVTLNMDTVNFLGISIVGHMNEDGTGGGIFVGSVMKGGAVAADGRIEPGDLLLEVNDINFENMTNDDAVKTLRDIVQTPGPIILTVAKCWDPEPVVPTFEPRMEPIRPIDPSAWVMHTNQHQADYGGYQYGRPFTGSPTLSTMTSNSSPSLNSSMPESDQEPVKLTLTTPMYRIARALTSPLSGLEVKDRIWLKMTIPKSFIGSDLVDWLHTNVEGFIDRRHARKYAALMLKHNFIRHTVNKITFSEQCYYIFGDFKAAANSLPAEFQGLNLSDSGDTDTLGPLPPGGIWGSSDGEYPLPPYDYFHNARSSTNTGSSKSPSPGGQGSGSSASSSTGASNSQSHSSHPSHHSPHLPHVNSNTNNGGGSGGSGYIPQYPRVHRSPSISSSSEFTSVSQQVPGSQPQPIQPLQNRSSSRSGSDKEPDRNSHLSTFL